MAKTRKQKEAAVGAMTENLKSSKSVVFSTYQGLTMKEQDELRGTLREQGARMMVEKKSLMRRVLADAKLEVPDETFEGPIAMTFGLEDEVAPAKILKDFGKKHEQIELRGGIFEQAYIDKERVTALASLPSREEMLAKTVATIKAPITGFVNVLSGNLRGFITALNAIKESKS